MAEFPSSPESSGQQGISLNELTKAYAQAMGSDLDADGEQQEPVLADSTDVEPDCPDEASTDVVSVEAVDSSEEETIGDGVAVSPMTVIETLIFVGNYESQPLDTSKIASLMRGVTPGDVAIFVEELNARYRANGCPYKIVGDGSGYRMTLRRRFHPVRNKFYGKVREARLSQAAVDTLAIVAYRQPLTSEQVTQLRGTPSGHLLTQLARRQLLEVERVEGSRQVFYRTSERFLELFGLERLDDLPDSE